MATTANLGNVAHARLGSPEKLNLRGVSRGDGANRLFEQELQKVDRLRPITADQMPWRLTKSQQSPRSPARGITQLPMLPENGEVKKSINNQARTTIPVFGNRADLASRAASRQSRLTTSSSREKPMVDEIEELVKEKMKTGYYVVKQAFKSFDPEGKGVVNRESLCRILSDIIARNIGLSQFNRLMIRLGLDSKKTVSIDEFYSAFRQPKKSDQDVLPEWLERQTRTIAYMTAPQVHAQLKEKARQRFLDLADLVPQMNPGGSGRILKPELQNALYKLGFPMEDAEFDKLWLKYDKENIGVIKGEVFFNKLGITLGSPGGVHDRGREATPARSPRRLETERSQSLDVERWLKKKFREGCSEMKHAFQEIDLDRTGRVTKAQFQKVLREYDLKLTTEKQVEDFLARCGVECDGKVPYKEFLRRFQDRSENGIPHKILGNPLHRYHQNDTDSKFSTTSAIEAKLMDMFQNDFLALLGTFHKIDRNDQGLITQEQFRAGIESRFELAITDEEFDQFLNSVPIDDEGMVKYVELMSRFDAKDQLSIFDTKSSIPERKFISGTSPPCSPRPRPPRSAEGDVNEGRSVEEVKRIIRKVFSHDYQAIQEFSELRISDFLPTLVFNAFYDIDELNSKRLRQDMFTKLMKRFGVDLTANEVKNLWKTLLTDQKRLLEFSQLVRHFGCTTSAQAYPNAKVSPPKRGDSDFMVRSNKLNSAVDLLFDQLKSKVELNWERIQQEFQLLDPKQCGNVSKEDFKDVMQSLCLEMADHEAELIAKKFQNQKDPESVCYAIFLEPFVRRRRIHRHGNNMQGVMSHRDNEFSNTFGGKVDKYSSITEKLRDKLSEDWISVRRAFKKLDRKNDGYLGIGEFRSVLQLCNIVLNEEEVFELLSKLDDKMQGKVNYREFLKTISR